MSVPAVFPVQSELRNIELEINETPGKKMLRDQEQYRKDGKDDAHWPLKRVLSWNLHDCLFGAATCDYDFY